MALITCPECGREISNQASHCPHCGFPLTQPATQMENQSISIIVTMAKQTFLFNSPVKIFLDDVETGWVGDGQTTTITVPKGKIDLTLTCMMRKRKLRFTANNDVNIATKWNRLTGSLEALCTGSDLQML